MNCLLVIKESRWLMRTMQQRLNILSRGECWVLFSCYQLCVTLRDHGRWEEKEKV
jgi:hypothetical protein